MLTSEFDYYLPDRLIASDPAPRGRSRMLVLGDGTLADLEVGRLPDHLRAGDALVVNDTRVIPARLFARKVRAEDRHVDPPARLELLLIEKLDDTTWTTLAKLGKRAQPGTRWEITGSQGTGPQETLVQFEVLGRDEVERGVFKIRFETPIDAHLEAIGHVPLPPYIARPDAPADRERYQTVYASRDGAIAAPTAGLHFSEELLADIRECGVQLARVTLHVGIGTFKPVTATLVHEHKMDAERYEVADETAEALNRSRRDGGRIVAVGTTVVRTLESSVDEDGVFHPGGGKTDLFIRPGYRFRAVDALLTNFHLPKSTLLMLVSAFAGKQRVLAAYRHAMEAGYRFYSYGDCMFIDTPAMHTDVS